MTARLAHLDSLRGLAAVTVAIFHFVRAFAPQALAPSALNASPLAAFWNGHFAVEVFFALSGYLFLWKFWGASPGAALLAMPKRYLRLTLPILGAGLAAWAIHAAGGFANLVAAGMTGSDWLGRWYRFAPSLGFASFEPLAGMYLQFDAWHSYNANLWTIRYELFVVCGVIAAGAVLARFPRWVQAAALAAFIVAAWDTYALAFVLGGAVAWARRWRDAALPTAAALAVIVAALWMGAMALPPGWSPRVAWPLAAALLVFALDAAPRVRTALSAKPLRVVGSLSFGFYITHFLTVNSVASATYVATGSVRRLHGCDGRCRVALPRYAGLAFAGAPRALVMKQNRKPSRPSLSCTSAAAAKMPPGVMPACGTAAAARRVPSHAPAPAAGPWRRCSRWPRGTARRSIVATARRARARGSRRRCARLRRNGRGPAHGSRTWGRQSACFAMKSRTRG